MKRFEGFTVRRAELKDILNKRATRMDSTQVHEMEWPFFRRENRAERI